MTKKIFVFFPYLIIKNKALLLKEVNRVQKNGHIHSTLLKQGQNMSINCSLSFI